MHIAIQREQAAGETRVAATPDTVKKLIALGHRLSVTPGAGVTAGILDAAFADAGASLADATDTADLVLGVRRPAGETLGRIKAGAGFVGLLEPHTADALVAEATARGVTLFAMEKVPRITRAQVMDALSSQANLAGYRAVIEASALYGRAFPMMMTAAGTVAAAKCLVMGAGVAGLQAIATARRLGAIVSATDVRPAAKEQVASLGAKFIAVEDDEFRAAETAAGYAKPMSAEYQAKQAALVAAHIAKQDVVITTALIPGRPAPVLVTPEMVATMRPGSVVIDLAAAQGGNCPLTKPDEVIEVGGVHVAGFTNLPARIGADASALYAKNLLALLPLLTGAEAAFAPKWDDEIVAAMAINRS
jgi:NAD(P) transhydrogenase subunit alpha